MNTYVAKLEEEVEVLKNSQQNQTDQQQQFQYMYEQQLKDLKLQRSKLEAQIKFGLDSLKMEQEKVRNLEEQLSKQSEQVSQSVQ